MLAIQVIPDRFSRSETGLLTDAVSSSTVKPFIRRPTRGIVIKDDTFATLRVVAGSSNKSIPIVDAGSNRDQPVEVYGKRATDVYSNFLLQQVQEDRAEKQQMLETFGEPYIFFFGERPRVMSFAGVLVNTFDFNWEAEWWFNYEAFLRGTKCVENDARVFLSFDNTLIGGYILASSATKVAQERNFVNFQFQMFVTSYTNFSDIGNPNAEPGLIGNGIADIFSDQASVEAISAQFRPKLLSDFGRIGISGNGLPTTGNGQVKMPSLEEGLVTQLSKVVSAWNSTRDVVTGIIDGISGALNGTYVRVPVGFAGSMAFDQEDDIRVRTVNGSQPVKYSTFKDNLDEYVGVGDHYGSSQIRSEFISNLGITTIDTELAYGQKLVEKATAVWAAPPYKAVIPEEKLGPISSFIVAKGLGLVGVAATRAVTASGGTIGAAGSAATRFANALPNPASVFLE